MKNHYVMNQTSQMLYRDTFEGCKAWAEKQTADWKSYGMNAPVYRIFYDTATEPSLTLNEIQSQDNCQYEPENPQNDKLRAIH